MVAKIIDEYTDRDDLSPGKKHYLRNKEKYQKQREENREKLNEKAARYREENREVLANKQAERRLDPISRDYNIASSRNWRLEDHRRYLLSSSKRRAKLKSLPHTISIDDIIIPELCPVLGIPLIVNKGNAGPNSPTIDRFKPELGYIPGNVFVISYKANTIKNNSTLDEILLVMKYMSGEPEYRVEIN